LLHLTRGAFFMRILGGEQMLITILNIFIYKFTQQVKKR